MSYGIFFESANGNVQIDSTTTNTGIIVIDSAASATSISFDPSKELLFAKPSSTSYTNQKVALRAPSGYAYNSAATYAFEDPGGTAVNMNYVLAKWSNEQTATSSFGIQVFNSDGDLAYDSGLYTGDGGIGIISFAAQQTLSGYGSSSTTSRMSTDTSKFYSMNSSFAIGNVNTFLGLEFNKSASIGAGVGVYWVSQIFIPSFGFGSGSGIIRIPNFTPRFIAEGGSV